MGWINHIVRVVVFMFTYALYHPRKPQLPEKAIYLSVFGSLWACAMFSVLPPPYQILFRMVFDGRSEFRNISLCPFRSIDINYCLFVIKGHLYWPLMNQFCGGSVLSITREFGAQSSQFF